MSPFDKRPEPVQAEPEAPEHRSTEEVRVNPSAHETSITFKGGSGYDAPWIVPKYAGIREALDGIGGSSDGKDNETVLAELCTRAAKIAAYFRDEVAEAMGGRATESSRPAAGKPAGATQAPNGKSSECAHGARVYKTGANKTTGKPWKGFFCPQPPGADQCDPEWA